MSYFSFMASDIPMRDVDNPRVMRLSVNEALEKRVVLPEMVLRSSTIDRDKPGVILWAESEESLGELKIKKAEEEFIPYDHDVLPAINLPYFSTLEWTYTPERVGRLIEYIRAHMQEADRLEIWQIWVGFDRDKSNARRREAPVNELVPEDLENIFVRGRYDYDGIAVRRAV